MRIRQVRIPKWIGLLQVELTNSFFYFGLINTVMLSITLWALVGPSLQARVPWVSYWCFLGVGLVGLVILLVVDFVFFYPARLRVINEQSCKHDNPAMQELLKHTDELKEHREILEQILARMK